MSLIRIEFENLPSYIEELKSRRKTEKIVLLLDEALEIYTGRSANEVIRIRAYLLASFLQTGLSRSAMPYVLEELQNGQHPHLIAGAARALRGQKKINPQTVPYLLKAIINLSHGDDSVSLEDFGPNDSSKIQTTAFDEIISTLRWYGGYARPWVEELRVIARRGKADDVDSSRGKITEAIKIIETDTGSVAAGCCSDPLNNSMPYDFFARKIKTEDLERILLEDQDGVQLSYSEYFREKPSIAVFFYTRCDNPNKCSLTITRLAQLQKELKKAGLYEGVKIAAFTYDPSHDTSSRLRNYCQNRQLELDENCRVFRVTQGFQQLQNYFKLGVNFVGSVVNKHRIELYLIDRDGRVRKAHTRTQWSGDAVVNQIHQLSSSPKGLKAFLRATVDKGLSVLTFLFLVFFPKCPFCWAAYMSVLGLTSLNALSIAPYIKPLLAIGLTINLLVQWRMCRVRDEFFPFYLSCCAALILFFNSWLNNPVVAYAGLMGIILASSLSALPLPMYRSIQVKVTKFFGKRLSPGEENILPW